MLEMEKWKKKKQNKRQHGVLWLCVVFISFAAADGDDERKKGALLQCQNDEASSSGNS